MNANLKRILEGNYSINVLYSKSYQDNPNLSDDFTIEDWNEIIEKASKEVFTNIVCNTNETNKYKVLDILAGKVKENSFDLNALSKFIVLGNYIDDEEITRSITIMKDNLEEIIPNYLNEIISGKRTISKDEFNSLLSVCAEVGNLNLTNDLKTIMERYNFEIKDESVMDLSKIELKEWLENDYVGTMLYELSGFRTKEEIIDAKNAIKILNSSEIEYLLRNESADKQYVGSIGNGFHYEEKDETIVRISRERSINELKNTLVHESLHRLCGFDRTNSSNLTGISEAMTEYLTFSVLGDKITEESGYFTIVNAFSEILDTCGISKKQLFEIYTSPNLNTLQSIIDSRTHEGFFENTLLPGLNKGINNDECKELNDAMNTFRQYNQKNI